MSHSFRDHLSSKRHPIQYSDVPNSRKNLWEIWQSGNTVISASVSWRICRIYDEYFFPSWVLNSFWNSDSRLRDRNYQGRITICWTLFQTKRLKSLVLDKILPAIWLGRDSPFNCLGNNSRKPWKPSIEDLILWLGHPPRWRVALDCGSTLETRRMCCWLYRLPFTKRLEG